MVFQAEEELVGAHREELLLGGCQQGHRRGFGRFVGRIEGMTRGGIINLLQSNNFRDSGSSLGIAQQQPQ